MGIIIRQAFWNTVVSYTGVVLGFLTVGIIFPRILTTDQNGLIRVLVSISFLFAQFANLGTNGAFGRFFPKLQDKEKKHDGLFTVVVVISTVGLGLVYLFYFLMEDVLIEMNKDKSAMLNEFVLMILPISLITLIFNVLDNFLRGLMKSIMGTIFRDLVQRIFILIAIFLYYLEYVSFNQFIYLYIGSLGISSIALWMYLIYLDEWKLGKWPTWEKSFVKQFALVSLFSIISNFTGTAMITIDTLMVNDMVGLGAAGIYSITFYFGTLINLPSKAIQRISNTVISEAWNKKDMDTLVDVYKKSCTNQLFIGSFLFLGIWANIDNIMMILPPEYEPGRYVIFFISLGFWADMATGLNGPIIGYSPSYRFDTYTMVGLLILIILSNLYFIPKIGLVGAAIASAVSLSVFNSSRLVFLYLKYKMQPFSITNLWIICIGIGTYGAQLLIPQMGHFIVDITIRSIFISIVYLGINYSMRTSAEINGLIQQLLNKIK